MNNTKELIGQCNLAFDFIQKLYLEVSYFIKEVEGLLGQEGFSIGKPSGYQVSFRSSAGLEPMGVNMWLPRKMAVFFAPKNAIKLERGQTNLSISQEEKVIYLRVLLNGKSIEQPTVYAGILHNIISNPKSKWIRKFEQAIQHIEYNDEKIFKGDLKKLSYEDSHIKFNGNLNSLSLFEINNSDTIKKEIVDPCLSLYEKHK